MIRAALLRVTGAAALIGIAASTGHAADLLELFRQAQRSDAVYASARSAWAATQEKLPQGRALLLPQASLSGNTNYNNRDIQFRNGISSIDRYNGNSIQATLTQPLYRPQNMVQYEQAKTQLTQADAQVAAAAQELIMRVAQAYFDVLLARDNIELARAQKTAIAEQYAFAKRSFEIGTATASDLHEAQARHDIITAQEVASRTDFENRRRVLQQIVGSVPNELVPVRPGFSPSPPESNSMDTWVDLAARDSPQVRAQQALVEYAEMDVQRNRAAHMPTVDLVLSHIRSGAGSGIQGGPGLDTVASGAGLQFAVPLYQGGATSSRTREAVANLGKANDDLDNARRSAELAARQAFLGMSLGVEQIAALRAASASTQRQLDSNQYGQKIGVRTLVDVLNSQQLFYSTQRDLAQATYTYILNDLRLRQAVGTLVEEDIVRVNTWLARDGTQPAAQADTRGVSAAGGDSPRPIPHAPPPSVVNTIEGGATALGLRLTTTLPEAPAAGADAKRRAPGRARNMER